MWSGSGDILEEFGKRLFEKTVTFWRAVGRNSRWRVARGRSFNNGLTVNLFLYKASLLVCWFIKEAKEMSIPLQGTRGR